jgi:nucleoside-diphosphate-sugar epimerase
MRILITGADQPLGSLAAAALRSDHEVWLTGSGALVPAGFQDLPYTPADLREPDAAAALLEAAPGGIEAVAHLQPHERVETPNAEAEKEALDIAARGTFVLLHAALKAGVRRVVLASRLDVMAGYPEGYLVDETWKPLPDAAAAALAPYLAELTLREFVRAEPLVGICLRLGELGSDPAGTTPEDAARAIRSALTMDLSGRHYRWWLYHICSTDRYRLGAAAGPPLHFTRSETTPDSV